MDTRKQIEQGCGFFTSGNRTVIFQRGSEDVFMTGEPSDVPNVRAGWHIAGGGYLLKGGKIRIEWCDLR